MLYFLFHIELVLVEFLFIIGINSIAAVVTVSLDIHLMSILYHQEKFASEITIINPVYKF